ncbi:uncharacterized protein LOC132708017 [Cylas formicarius]|uniref:uncharacterized protein LOC132708017 n=1 Tax=Cylas formicarius TaxID=197179 RepID=UPI002958DBF8|nr:uncharacterized protein LOC132708017 [Cylas formicarius]
MQNETELKNRKSPKVLSPASIPILKTYDESSRPVVPPNTPKNFELHMLQLPQLPTDIDKIEIPIIREVGIRDSIVIISKYFGCEDYKLNLVQFWFVDIILDLLWRCQDEYNFPLEYQKAILEWFFFIVKFMGVKNMTRNQLFEIFDEAINLAEEYVNSGCTQHLPSPNNLFTVKYQFTLSNDIIPETTAKSSDTNTSIKSENKYHETYFALTNQGGIRVFKMPEKSGSCADPWLSSSIETLSEQLRKPKRQTINEDTQSEDSANSESLCQSDIGTHSSLKSLQKSVHESPNDLTTFPEECIGDVWYNIPKKNVVSECPSLVIEPQKDLSQPMNSDSSTEYSIGEPIVDNPQHIKQEIFKAFYDYNFWTMKNEYMADPNKGWSPSLDNSSNQIKESSGLNPKRQFKFPSNDKQTPRETNKNVSTNSCLIMAVKQFVFDYFYDSFAFELIKSSLNGGQYTFMQDLNTVWFVPKQNKTELKKPTPKNDQLDKTKTNRKNNAAVKKPEKIKDENIVSEISKTGKSKPLDKKQKRRAVEMETVKMEHKLDEVDATSIQTYILPLNDAVNDNFFSNIFVRYRPKKTNWK